MVVAKSNDISSRQGQIVRPILDQGYPLYEDRDDQVMVGKYKINNPTHPISLSPRAFRQILS
jgi:hypothetical protein